MADQLSQIDSSIFINYVVSPVPSDVIKVGDTISVGFYTQRRFYSIGTHLKFSFGWAKVIHNKFIGLR